MNPNSFRPEVQARKIALARHPVRQHQVARFQVAKGLTRERMKVWTHAWACAGHPAAFPDFEEFWATAPEAKRWEIDRKYGQAHQRWLNRKYKVWNAAGNPADEAWWNAYDAANPSPVHPGYK